MNKMIRKLLKAGVIGGKTVVMNATFIKAYSERDPHARYKLHVVSDAKSELPLAHITAPASENEKKHASELFDKVLRTTKQWMNTLVADSQYLSRKLRIQASGCGVKRESLEFSCHTDRTHCGRPDITLKLISQQ